MCPSGFSLAGKDVWLDFSEGTVFRVSSARRKNTAGTKVFLLISGETRLVFVGGMETSANPGFVLSGWENRARVEIHK